MPHAYIGLTSLKAAGALNITGTASDGRLLQLLEAIADAIDDYAGRTFHPRVETKYFSGNGKASMLLPDDLISVTSLKEDDTLLGTGYATTWATTDYVLAPYDAQPTNSNPERTSPYTKIEVDRRNQGTKHSLGRGQRRFELAGKWGWSESQKTTGATTSEELDISETAIDVSSGAAFEVGQTILVESEQMYITGISSNTLTVIRAVNGTTAATHATAKAITILQYLNQIREASLMEAARLWTMRTSGFASSVGNPDTGQVTVYGGQLQPRARALLDPFRRIGL